MLVKKTVLSAIGCVAIGVAVFAGTTQLLADERDSARDSSVQSQVEASKLGSSTKGIAQLSEEEIVKESQMMQGKHEGWGNYVSPNRVDHGGLMFSMLYPMDYDEKMTITEHPYTPNMYFADYVDFTVSFHYKSDNQGKSDSELPYDFSQMNDYGFTVSIIKKGLYEGNYNYDGSDLNLDSAKAYANHITGNSMGGNVSEVQIDGKTVYVISTLAAGPGRIGPVYVYDYEDHIVEMAYHTSILAEDKYLPDFINTFMPSFAILEQ